MAKKTIWANCIVNNEENFIWFALMSVVDFVDKILVWDTGSTDKTVQIIKEAIKVKGDKIELKEVGIVDKYGFTKMRQKMLEESKCDWIIVLDGDEIWWEKSISKVVKEISCSGEKIEGIVVPVIVLVGDIHHIQEKSAGRYEILGRKGHYNLRAVNKKIPGLHVNFPYGRESYFDCNNKLVQERSNIIFIDAPYLHVTHLLRSSKSRIYNKFKLEIGNSIPQSFMYPEIFLRQYPVIINNPWQKLSLIQYLLASIITPFRRLKRKFQ